MRIEKKGLTLVELITTLVLLVILMGIAIYVFVAVSVSWSGQYTRAGIDIKIDRAMEEIVRDLRKAQEIGHIVNNAEIRFTADGSSFYIYYFYNENDTYPPDFNQASYEVRKAALAEDVYGGFLYGEGPIIIGDVAPPPASCLSIDTSGRIITIDLKVARGSETIRSRTEVMPRNL